MTEKFALKVSLKNAEKAKQLLKEQALFAFGFQVMKTKEFIFFPLEKPPSMKQKNRFKKPLKGFKIVKKNFKKLKEYPRTLKQALKDKLTKKEFSQLVTAFDLIGTIAIIEIPKALEKKEKLIAQALLAVNKSIETVCKITGKHTGKYRIQPVKVLAGKKSTIAEYKEAGCRMQVDISKVFFSPRLSRERLRISKLIKKQEIVATFFAGVGPFPLVFAKNSKMQKSVAIELNPHAFKLMKKNISLNKCEKKIKPIFGDVKKVAKNFLAYFDRIAMPLPEGAAHFLESAFHAIKPGGVIHFYQFEPKEDPFSQPIKKIKNTAKKFNKKVKILRKAQVRTFSPKKIQVVIDFKVK